MSLKSMVGLDSERSMRMRVWIGTTPVINLVDSGATSNFISKRLVHSIGLPMVWRLEMVK